jgi:GH18 family chitinase
MRAKGQFITEQGLKGFSMWEVGGDPSGTLVEALLSGMG